MRVTGLELKKIRSFMYDFIHGGDSDAARLGLRVGAWVDRGLQYAVLGLISLTMVALGQLQQHRVSEQDLRLKAVLSWADAYPEQQQLADRFVQDCLPLAQQGLFDQSDSLALRACALSMGAGKLLYAVQQADSTLATPAWPLSLMWNRL